MPSGVTTGSSPSTRARVLERMPSAATTRSKDRGRAVRERDLHPGAVVVETGDVVAEHVLDVGGGLLHQQPGQIAAQDLQLGRGPVGVRAARGEGRDGAIVGVDEADPGLPGRRGPDRVLQTHPAGDLAAGAADVDVLTARPELGGALDHGHLEAVAVQPGREGGTGDAGAGDQDGGHRRTSDDAPIDGCAVSTESAVPPVPHRHGGVAPLRACPMRRRRVSISCSAS